MNIPQIQFDINQPEFIASPWQRLEELRKDSPAFFEPRWNKVFFTRHQDITKILRDKRFGRQITHLLSRDELGWPPPNPRIKDFDHFQENHILDLEPPRHTRLRGLVSKAFTQSRVEALRPRIEHIANNLLDAKIQTGQMNLVEDFATHIPVLVIAELLGIPAEHRHKLRPWSAAIVKLYELGYSEAAADAANLAVIEFSNLLRELTEQRRTTPGDDLLSALVRVEEEGQRLSMDELIATSILLLNAGHEATVNGTSLAVLALLKNPDQNQELQQALLQEPYPALLKTAVEEFLRYESPLPMFERWVLEDCVIAGVQLKRGQEVGLLYASGNRDEDTFENANELQLNRTENPHLTFGLGTHYCLGAPLARLEMSVSLSALLRRLPNLKQQGPEKFATGFVIRGLLDLPVAW